MSFEVEPCAGCGLMAHDHPIVGIARDEDKRWAAFPICYNCHVNPEHRKSKLKMHFFTRDMKDIALARAGSNDIG